MIESNYVFSTKGVSIGYKLLSTLSTLRSGRKVGKNNFEENILNTLQEKQMNKK